MSTHDELKAALQAIRDLAKEQGGRISPREAHDAWRWILVNFGWKPGPWSLESRQHPSMIAFDSLPESNRDHALQLVSEVRPAEQPAVVEASTNGFPKQNIRDLGWRRAKAPGK